MQDAEASAVNEILTHINQTNSGLFEPKEVDIVETLQNFAAHVSSETIKLYHAELQQKLSKQGIDI